MSKYSELVEEFYMRYEKPVLEQYVMGFSGIDPPLKRSGQGLDHEKLNGLLGGDENGHYHLTRAELDALLELLGEKYPPEITAGQKVNTTAEEEMTPYEIQGRDVRR